MINITHKYKRINFLISKALIEQLQNYSEVENIPISKVIKKWTKNSTELKLFEVGKNNTTNYTIRIDYETYKLIEKKSTLYGVSRSDFIRLLILNNLKRDNKIAFTKENIQELWDAKEFKYIVDLTRNSLDIYSPQELSLILNSKLQLTDYTDLTNIFSILRKKSISSDTERYIALVLGEIMLARKDIGAVEYFESIYENILKSNNLNIVGRAYLTKAKLFDWVGKYNYADGEYYAKKAIKCFTKTNNKLKLIETYSLLTRIYDFQVDYAKSDLCVKKAKEIANGDEYFEFKINSKEAYSKYARGDSSVNNKNNLIETIKINKGRYENLFELRDQYNYLARIYLANGDFKTALNYFTVSKSYEMQYRYNPYFTTNDLYKLFIESFSDPVNTIPRMNNILHSKLFTMKSDTFEYLINLSKYLNGGEKDKVDGVIQLRKLTDKGSYDLARAAASNSLKSKFIEPLR